MFLFAVAYLIIQLGKNDQRQNVFDYEEKTTPLYSSSAANNPAANNPVANNPVANKIKSQIVSTQNETLKRLQENPAGEQIFIGTVDPYDVAESQEFDFYYADAVAIVNETFKCFTQKGLCGLEEQLKQQGEYYNPRRTPLHYALQTSLNLIRLSFGSGHGDIKDIDENSLKKYLTVEHNEIPLQAAQLLLSDEKSFDNNYNYILKQIPKVHGTAKTHLLSMMASPNKNTSAKQRRKFLDTLRLTLTDKSNVYDAYLTQKRLSDFNLSNHEFVNQAHHLCHLKKDLKESGAWASTYRSLIKQAKNQGIALSLRCPYQMVGL